MVLDSFPDLQGVYQGKSGAIKRKEYRVLLHFGLVAIEMMIFGSPSTTVANFLLFLFTLFLDHMTPKSFFFSSNCMFSSK